MPHDSTAWLHAVNTKLDKIGWDPILLAQTAGCYSAAVPAEEVRAHWESAKVYEERLIVTQVFESFLPEIPSEEKCDYAGCLRAAGWVWYRTREEIKRGSTARFKLGERQQVCGMHKVGWRPWVPVGAARPVEAQERRSQPKARKMLPAATEAPQGRRKHACPTCRCEVRE